MSDPYDRYMLVNRVIDKATTDYVSYGRTGDLNYTLLSASAVLCVTLTDEERERALGALSNRISALRAKHPRKYSHL